MSYCVNKLTAQKGDKTAFILKKINNNLYLIVIQEFQNSRISFPFELHDLPLHVTHTHMHTHQLNVPLHCQLPGSPNLHTYSCLKAMKNISFSSCSLCCSRALISLFACLTLLFLCSSPFSPIRTCKKVYRNKAAYSQKSPKEVLPPSRSFSNCGAVTSKATLLK